MDTARARSLLGIPVEAVLSPEDLRSAHRAAIRRAHPDAGGSDFRAVLVNEAYAHLVALCDTPERSGPCGAGSSSSTGRTDDGTVEGHSGTGAGNARTGGSSRGPGFTTGDADARVATGYATGFRPGPDPAWSIVDAGVPPDDPTELLLRIVEAAHEIGEVVSVDLQTGLVEVIVNAGKPGFGAGALGAGQLLVQVGGDPHPGGGMRVRHSTQPGAGAQARTFPRPEGTARSGGRSRAPDSSLREDDGIPVAFTLEPLGAQPAPPIHEVVADLMRHVRAGADP